ncbi:MAG: hypothetical protein GY698_23815 [Actinomycetia bacterium]|nr:hypothetical protein [Actinomycetes bacterium]
MNENEPPSGRPADKNAELVELGDIDELLRHVDRLVADRDWAGLVDLRDRSRAALERGRQLWPVAAQCEYRTALHAPAELAATMVVEGAGQFTLGPLAEVVAQGSGWAALAPHVAPGPLRSVLAHERILRGEDLTTVADIALEVPLRIQSWEPDYALAEYREFEADFPHPDLPRGDRVELPPPAPGVDDPDVVNAFRSVVQPWTAQSNGRAEVVAIEGTAEEAVSALGPRLARWVPLSPADSFALLAWAGASGGAHGRRRGAAAGRIEAWWTAAVLTGLDDTWPVEPEDLGQAAAELKWFAWSRDEPDTGWNLRLAIEDPVDGLAWAVAASDASMTR